jgi:hypothetical protein
MRIRRASWSLLVLAIACARPPLPSANDPKPKAPNPMVPLTGEDAAFVERGRRSFPRSKMLCFEAVRRTFRNTGHGLDHSDPETGRVVSGKTTVYRGVQSKTSQTFDIVDDKFYVRVDGDEVGCAVTVTKLRVWQNTVEVETRLRRWIEGQLGGFMRGVAAELADRAGGPLEAERPAAEAQPQAPAEDPPATR